MSVIRRALAACAAPITPIDENGMREFRREYHPGTDFVGFAGHFPEHPVLPAVAQILMAEMTISQATGTDMHTGSIRNAKFLRPVPPGICIACIVTPHDDSGNLWDCRLYVDNALAASFQWQGISLQAGNMP